MASFPSPTNWEAFLANQPGAHLLQTVEWGKLKSRFGWNADWIQAQDCGAQVLLRRLPLGLCLAYIPMGPVGPWLPQLLPSLDEFCRRQRAFALKIEPDGQSDPQLATALREHGFLPSPQTVQPPRTLVVPLEGSEEQILARMQQKTRYNIRLAARKGVAVRPWDDLDRFGLMVHETAERDRFGAHVPAYYQLAYSLFHPAGNCELLAAEFEGQVIAALMVFKRGPRAWYLYGASADQHRSLMPNYLLQWEAMRWARAQGCRQYDLWGVPDAEQEELESQFTERNDGLWGVYRFKRGFGGQLVRTMGAWDRPYQRTLYRLYHRWMARLSG